MNITSVFEALGALLAAICAAILVPLLRKKTTREQRVDLKVMVQLAVVAAERLFIERGRGKQKKEYAIKWLADRGIQVDEKKLDAMIENAVRNLKNFDLESHDGEDEQDKREDE